MVGSFAKKYPGRLLGLDIGTKKIGVAISDESRTISSPKKIIANSKTVLLEIKGLIDDNRIAAIVVGLPLDMRGNKIPMTYFVEEFAKNLEGFLQKNYQQKIEIFFSDERLTSFEAKRIEESGISKKSKKRNACDDIAASIILTNFINSDVG